MHIRLIGDSRLAVGVNVSMNDCLSPRVSPVMDWQTCPGWSLSR